MTRLLVQFMTTVILLTGCTKEDGNIAKDDQPSFVFSMPNNGQEFWKTITQLEQLSNVTEKEKWMNVFWDSLKTNGRIPFAFNDSVIFLYKGKADSVAWAGDFNKWNPTTQGYNGTLVSDLGFWYCRKSFPIDARLDYKIVINGKQWILDPANGNLQMSGFGPNSELRMPGWKRDEVTVENPNVPKGTVSDWIKAKSTALNYNVQYKIYTPVNYQQHESLPVVYMTDGQEYLDKGMGNIATVLDNLIADNKIVPLMAIFIDPRNPENISENRRMTEYNVNKAYADFVADELSVIIDSSYKTHNHPNARMIMGTSMGGLNAAYFGISRSDRFGLIAIHSPAFWYNAAIYELFRAKEKQPVQIFMSTGTINDTQEGALTMKSILDEKQYPLLYLEVNEGHSWGNWRQLMDEPLLFFFGKDK